MPLPPGKATTKCGWELSYIRLFRLGPAAGHGPSRELSTAFVGLDVVVVRIRPVVGPAICASSSTLDNYVSWLADIVQRIEQPLTFTQVVFAVVPAAAY